MFSKLFGKNKYDLLEERLANIEAENAALAAANAALEEKINEKSPKEIATEAKMPWVDVITTTFEDPEKPNTGYFELDWNEYFVKSLIEAGYSGRTDDDIVNMWFNDLCRGVIGDKI